MRALSFGTVPWPGRATGVPADAEAARVAVEDAVEEGGLDAVLVRLTSRDGPLEEGLDAALRPAFLVARAAVWELLAGEDPSLVFVVDDAPTVLGHALDGGSHALCRSLAKEYGRSGLRCNRLRLRGPVPDEDARAALRFLLLEARFITGETLTLEAR